MTDDEKRSIDPNISVITARLFDLILKMPTERRQALLKQLESEEINGKRRCKREKYYKSVDFATKDRIFRGFIQNISADGLLIEAMGSFSVGEHITLSFELPKNEGHIKIGGTIVRLLPQGGFGVKFNSTIKDLT